jgi:hypothetical protein
MDNHLERGSVSQPSLPETQPAASLAEAEAAFRRAHPRYDDTTVLDELRRGDFTRLDTGGHVYLDYTGAWPLRRLAAQRAPRAASRERVR